MFVLANEMSETPEGAVPIYLHIKEQLRQSIISGERSPDARMPSERVLAQRYGISRMTARQALRALVQEGYAYTRTGSGTFVHPAPIKQQLQLLTSFSEDARSRGVSARSEILSAEIAPASGEAALRLCVKDHAEVVTLRRLRYVGETPMAIETSHIPYRLCPEILARFDFRKESLYRVLTEIYNHRFAWAEQTILARPATPEEARLLGIKLSMPVLAMLRLTYDSGSQPVEFVRSIYRSDQYQLHTVLRTQIGNVTFVPPTAQVSLQRIETLEGKV